MAKKKKRGGWATSLRGSARKGFGLPKPKK